MDGEKDLIGDFLHRIGRDRAIEFIRDVAESEPLMMALCNIDLTTDAVTLFANAQGYAFFRSDLESVI